MATPITITSESPERGWPPFLDWLRSHDLNPGDVRSISVDGTTATAQIMVRGVDGFPLVDGDEIRIRTETVAVHTPPPRRIQTGAR